MSANHERVESLFNEALKFAPAERPAFLAGACGSDAALRRQLEELLKAEAEAGGFLPEAPQQRATIKLDLADAPDEAVGQTLGRYKLLERVGEGGCGVVYVAEQKEPVRRRVALKVIKLGMDTKQVVARFEAERQALAMMDHPNIAKVLDAGTIGASDSQLSTPSSQLPQGRPFFVMELVRGIRITDYCDQANCTTKERLDLFIKVCKAIQHAHQAIQHPRDDAQRHNDPGFEPGRVFPGLIDCNMLLASGCGGVMGGDGFVGLNRPGKTSASSRG